MEACRRGQVRHYEALQRRGALGEHGGELFCLCQTPWDPDRPMIGCDFCDGWYHLDCVGIPSVDAADDILKYKCSRCQARWKTGARRPAPAAATPAPSGALGCDGRRDAARRAPVLWRGHPPSSHNTPRGVPTPEQRYRLIGSKHESLIYCFVAPVCGRAAWEGLAKTLIGVA